MLVDIQKYKITKTIVSFEKYNQRLGHFQAFCIILTRDLHSKMFEFF